MDSQRPTDASLDEQPHATHRDTDGAPSPFPHPPWTVSLILVAGVITLLFGILVNPIWLVVGSPFVIVLGLWLYIRIVVRPERAP